MYGLSKIKGTVYRLVELDHATPVGAYVLATAPPTRLGLGGIFKAHPQRLAADGLAVEPCDCRTGLMAFHSDRAEPAALSSEDVAGDTDRTNDAEV